MELENFETLLEISDESFGFDTKVSFSEMERIQASRSIIIDDENRIGIIYVSKSDFYKIPGGGVKENETIIQGLHREIMEEAGVKIEVVDTVGKIIENRYQKKIHKISYCFLSRVIGQKGLPQFSEKEQRFGFQLKRFDEDQIKKILNRPIPEYYSDKFRHIRDMTFLKKGISLIDRLK